MAKRKPAKRRRAGHKLHLFGTALALVIGLSLHSCADIPAKRELLAASAGVKALIEDLGTAVREQAARTGLPGTAVKPAPTASARTDGATKSATESFSTCQQFFAASKPPVVPLRPTHRALCYDAFAILHSGESKTAVYVAQKLNRALVADADESAPTSSLPMRACAQPKGRRWRITGAADLIAATWRRPARCPRLKRWRKAFPWPTSCRRPPSTTRTLGACRSRTPPTNMPPGPAATCM